jgi:hypothetical protein
VVVPVARRRHDDVVGSCEVGAPRGHGEVLPGADGRHVEAGGQRRAVQPAHEVRVLGHLLDRRGGRVDLGRQAGVGRGEDDLAGIGVPGHGQACGHRRAPVGGAQGDQGVHLGQPRVARVHLVRERLAGHQAALGMGDDVDRDARVPRLQAGQELAQPATGLPDVVGRVRLGVLVLIGGAAAIGEPVVVARRVAQGGGVHIVDGALFAGRPQAGHPHEDVALRRLRRNDGLRRARLAGPPPVVGGSREAGPVWDRVELLGVVDEAAELVDVSGDLGGGRVLGPFVGRGAGGDRPGGPALEHAGQAGPLPSLGLGTAQLVGDEVDLGWSAEELGRVEVRLTGPHTEVEPVLRGADGLALADLLAPADRDALEERVAGTEAVVMEDDDMKAPRHRPCEDHLAVGGGGDRSSRLGGVLEPPVARLPVLRRWAEGIDDG